jgi:hypothetical protein
MQQSMANAFGGDLSSGELQYIVNSRGLHDINVYCHRSQPIQQSKFISQVRRSSTTEQHAPFTRQTSATNNRPSSSDSAGRPASQRLDVGTLSCQASSNAMTTSLGKIFTANEEDEETESVSRPSATNMNSTGPFSISAAPGINYTNKYNSKSNIKQAKLDYHPLVQDLHQALNSSALQLNLKNVELLEALENLCVMLHGIRITFCKSGKDRTGMVVTLDQARQIITRYGLVGNSNSQHYLSLNNGPANNNSTITTKQDYKLLALLDIMRLYGTRLAVAEKNIGRAVFSFNLLQARFLPPMLRPPPQVCEAMLKKDNS